MAGARAATKPKELAALHTLYGPGLSDDLVIRNHFRDAIGTTPARWVAGRWSRQAPAYLYRFDYVDEAQRKVRSRAYHGAEIFYVFQTLGLQPADPPTPTAGDARLAVEMHARWVAFARTGVPDAPGSVHWPAYSRRADPWMVFGPNGSSVRTGVRKAQLDWHERRTTPLIWLLRMKTETLRLFGA
jgi:para-nitrobenzyl esterase